MANQDRNLSFSAFRSYFDGEKNQKRIKVKEASGAQLFPEIKSCSSYLEFVYQASQLRLSLVVHPPESAPENLNSVYSRKELP